MQPIVNGLQAIYEDRIAFDAIDAASDSGSVIFHDYRLRGHPSYVIVDMDGEPLWSLVGLTSQETLQEQIDSYAK